MGETACILMVLSFALESQTEKTHDKLQPITKAH